MEFQLAKLPVFRILYNDAEKGTSFDFFEKEYNDNRLQNYDPPGNILLEPQDIQELVEKARHIISQKKPIWKESAPVVQLNNGYMCRLHLMFL